MSSFRTLLVILSTVNFIVCLPITSKPIENTPEHLAWEAWIMIPPTQNKTRKITPKSIFILPEKTTNTHITCPPDHRIDNFKCIKTVQINQQEILLNQFANIFNSSNYDYDYDYDTEEAHKLVGQPTNTVPSYNNNGGPLKIDLLGQLPIETDDNKDSFDFGTSIDDGLNAQPFRSEASSSTTTSSTTQASTSESDNNIPYFVAISTSPGSTTTSTVVSNPTVLSTQSLSTTTESSTSLRPTTTTVATTSAIPLTSSTTTSLVSTNNKESGEDYDLIEEDTKRTYIPDGEIELVTVTEFAQTDLKQDLFKESLLVQSTRQPITIEPSESADSTEEPSTSIKESNLELVTTLAPPFETAPIKKYSYSNQNLQIMKATDDPYASKDFAGSTIQIQDEAEPIMQSIENNNRFVYHHLGSTSSSSKKPERSESRTPDVQEQLRIINKIVEENRKRAELGSKVKFPSDTFIQTDNLRADFIRFPEPTASRVITQTMPPPARLFTDTKVIPILRKPSTILAPTTSTTRIASTTTEKLNTKPFWWLPSTWEVDRNGDRPLLLRFWSRSSPTSSSPTTSGFRENSRSPTDNLYREISAQDVYKVLGARTWHHNTNEFT